MFVGDLPAAFTSDDLAAMFGDYGCVVHARIVGEQCFGFVTFETAAEAEALLDFVQHSAFYVEDRPLRVNWARGALPDWKVRGRGRACGRLRRGWRSALRAGLRRGRWRSGIGVIVAAMAQGGST